MALLAITLAGLSGVLGLNARADGAAAKPRVVLVTGDCGSGNFLCPGFMKALRETGVSGRLVSPDFREDPLTTLSLLARQKYDLVIVDPFGPWRPLLGKVARDFPNTKFALFDDRYTFAHGKPQNVVAVIHEPREAAFLAGFLAVRMEQRRPGRDLIGVVGGEPVPGVDTFIVGYRAGAHLASKGAVVLTDYSHDFLDPSKCEALARRQIARGAGVVFDVAGGCGLGALRAAKERGVWGIGVDTDQSFLGPHILTSVLKRYDVGFATLMRDVRDGTWRGGRNITLTLRNDGAGLGRISPRVPRSLRSELDGVRRRIVSGRIRVPKG